MNDRDYLLLGVMANEDEIAKLEKQLEQALWQMDRREEDRIKARIRLLKKQIKIAEQKGWL